MEWWTLDAFFYVCLCSSDDKGEQGEKTTVPCTQSGVLLGAGWQRKRGVTTQGLCPNATSHQWLSASSKHGREMGLCKICIVDYEEYIGKMFLVYKWYFIFATLFCVRYVQGNVLCKMWMVIIYMIIFCILKDGHLQCLSAALVSLQSILVILLFRINNCCCVDTPIE